MNEADSLSNAQRWLITVTIMLVTIIELLDMTIVVVAMHAMMGSLSANTEQITWIVTAYIVAAAIVILLTGFLTTRFGRRKVLLIAVAGFLTSSILCGLSSSIMEIVVFRVFQGMFGAVFIPTSQTVLKSIFPEKDQGLAMSIWAIGLMAAPVLGPTVGGYITDHFSWRWCFYINAPFCLISFAMILRFIKETPTYKTTVDWLGIGLVIVGIGSLQILLDQGNSHDWFNAHLIVGLTFLSVGCIGYLIFHCLTTKNPILNLRLFGNYNFMLCSLILACYMGSVLGSITLQPIFIEQLMRYPAETTGLLLAPRGLASAFSMIIVGKFIKQFDPRWFIAIGICLTYYGTYMMTGYTLNMGPHYILFSAVIQGLGMGFSIVPLATLCTKGFAKKDLPQGTALFSFSRSLGNALGVSILTTVITRETQINWHRLSTHLSATNANLQQWFQAQHQNLHNPVALQHLENLLFSQASGVAFVDMFWLASIILVLLLPLVYLLKT